MFVSSKSVKAIKSYGNLKIGISTHFLDERHSIITPPARRAWRSYKFASLGFSGGFFWVSEVGLPLMGDTAGTKLHEPI